MGQRSYAEERRDAIGRSLEDCECCGDREKCAEIPIHNKGVIYICEKCLEMALGEVK